MIKPYDEAHKISFCKKKKKYCRAQNGETCLASACIISLITNPVKN